jgi:hypothetical protein
VVKESSSSGVEFKQSAQAVAMANGCARGVFELKREEEKIAITLMVPFKVMMFDVIVQRPPSRSFPKQNESGQAFFPDGTLCGQNIR